MTLRLSAPDWCFFRPGMTPRDYYETLRGFGYEGVEMVDPARFADARAAGLEILNLGAPGMMEGLNREEHHAELLPGIREVMQTASENHIGAVILFSGNRAGQDDAVGLGNVARGIEALLPDAERLGVELWFEMLCQRDHPDYQADHAGYGFELRRRVASDRLRLLYDVYHMSQMGEDVREQVASNRDDIAHIHLADLPDRSCLRDDEQVAFHEIRDAALGAGYAGYFGMEFIPRAGGLDEAREAAEHFRS